jgi:tetratricopeptide (TPR) repeat protein
MFRMKTLSLSIVCALSAAGCSTFNGSGDTLSWRVAPAPMVQGQTPAEVAYQAGRRHHATLQYQRAIAAYREALQLDPSHAGSRNGLGIVLAAVGRHDEAVRELEAAVAIAPHLAYLRNNLGYAHLLRGALTEARKEFEAAGRLDPSNRKVAENLRVVRMRLAGPADAPAKPASASAPKAKKPASPSSAPATPKRADSTIVLVSPQVYEMREPQSALPVVAMSVPAHEPIRPVALPAVHIQASAATTMNAPASAAAPKSVRLEVSNGNGLNGFAKRIAAALTRMGWAQGRLTNQLPFRQPVTEVQYREGYAAEASRLAASLKSGVLVIRNDSLAAHVDVRLVLGRDAWTENELLRQGPAEGAPVQLVSATPGR